MNISLTPPPSQLPPELERWLSDFMIQVSGALMNREEEVRRAKVELQEARDQIVAIKAYVGMP